MKPDWKDAPEWAKWLAQDANGGWYWYDSQPAPLGWAAWISQGPHELAITSSKNWRETLEQRPPQDNAS